MFGQGATDEMRELMNIKQCLRETAYGQLSALRVDKAVGGSTTTTYIGMAPPGSDPAAAVWQISKLIEVDLGSGSGTTVRSWAQTDSSDTDYLTFNKVWDNRASYTYAFESF